MTPTAGTTIRWGLVNQSTGPRDALTGPGRLRHGCHRFAWPQSGQPSRARPLRLWPAPPLLVISPWAKQNFVDHTVTDQTSVMRFIEDNWLGGQRIGQGNFDSIASSISQMFDFTSFPFPFPLPFPGNGVLLLNPSTGEPMR